MADKKVEKIVQGVNKSYHRYKQLEFDKLKTYFGYPYVIDLEGVEGSITVKQPTIGDIAEFGEKRFYSTLNVFITNASSYKVMLDEVGVDWNDISDFDLFLMLYKSGIDQEAAKLIFDNIDFSKFELLGKNIEVPPTEEGGETTVKQIPVLYDADDNIEIDELTYQYIHQYLQYMFQIYPDEKYTNDSTLKKWYIMKDKREVAMAAKKDDGEKSSLLAVISSCINHPGFKYNLEQLKSVGVCQFYDSVKRLQVYESSTACLKGMFSGFVDGSKIKPDEYNFMKEI